LQFPKAPRADNSADRFDRRRGVDHLLLWNAIGNSWLGTNPCHGSEPTLVGMPTTSADRKKPFGQREKGCLIWRQNTQALAEQHAFGQSMHHQSHLSW